MVRRAFEAVLAPHPTLNEDPQAPSTACLARPLRTAALGFPLRSSSPSRDWNKEQAGN